MCTKLRRGNIFYQFFEESAGFNTCPNSPHINLRGGGGSYHKWVAVGTTVSPRAPTNTTKTGAGGEILIQLEKVSTIHSQSRGEGMPPKACPEHSSKEDTHDGLVSVMIHGIMGYPQLQLRAISMPHGAHFRALGLLCDVFSSSAPAWSQVLTDPFVHRGEGFV